jgi:cytochrome c biogenesis protein CcmG/thiol:disulfide interchange protein DsbE
MERLVRGPWRWLLIPLLALPIGWLLFTGLGRDPRLVPSALVGHPLPQLAGSTLDGDAFSTASLAGKPALVNVWASWCAPCVAEHPLLLDAARRFGDQLQLVGIDYQDTTHDAESFLAEHGEGGWPDVADPSGRIAIALGVTAPPETFFVDAAGIVRYRHVGPLTAEVLDEQLAALGVVDR